MKYKVPGFLVGIIGEGEFRKWLKRKAVCHYRRDRRRGNTQSKFMDFVQAIYDAILQCEGKDAYTGKDLRWDLISTYDNEKAIKGKREYKADFADLPTIDHVDDGLSKPNFKVCAWKVNESKAQLTLDEFIDLCKDVLEHHGYKISPPC